MKNKKIIMVFAITLMAIGFASVSTVLYLNGQTFVASNEGDFDVYFSKAVENGTENASIIKDKTHIEFTTELTGLNDKYVLDYDVTNGSKQYDANLVMSCIGGNEYLRVSNKFDTTEILPARTTRSGVLTLTVIKVPLTEMSVSISCEISGNAVERNEMGGEIIEIEEVGYLLQAYEKKEYEVLREKVDLHNFSPLGFRFIEETYGSYEAYDSQFQEKCSGDWDNESETCIAFKNEDEKKYNDYCDLKIYGEVGKYNELYNAACPNGEDDASDSCKSFFDDYGKKWDEKNREINRKYYERKISANYLWSPVKNEFVESISFVNTNKVPSNAFFSWDASAQQNGSIVAYVLNEDNDIYYEVYIGQNGGVNANPNSSYLFYLFSDFTSGNGFSSLKEINGLENLDTSNVIDMGHMFYECNELTSANVSGWDTSKVTNMEYMFNNCKKLETIDVGNWNTSNVTNMKKMFCGIRTEPNIDNWDLKKANTTKDALYCPV